MKLSEIKKEMLQYTDFFGGDLPETDAIRKAKTKEELSAIIDRHQARMEDMLNDAGSHLNSFKKRIGLFY